MSGDLYEIECVWNQAHQRWSDHIENVLGEKRNELGFEHELKDISGISTQMFVALGDHGIKSIEDLAGCAADDLRGWSELRRGRRFRHAGILEGFKLSRKDCNSIIINARIKAG